MSNRPSPLNFGEVDQERHVATFHHLGRLFLVTLAHIGVGLALGAFLVKMMYKRSLHWTWGALACAIVGIADLKAPAVVNGVLNSIPFGPAIGPLGLLVITLRLALRGRRWHGEDSGMGGARGHVVEQQLTPLDAIRRLSFWWQLTSVADGRTVSVSSDGILMGTNTRGLPVYVPYDRVQGKHFVIIGSTGSGKSVTATLIGNAAIEEDDCTIYIELKNDGHMFGEATRHALLAGKEVIEISCDGPIKRSSKRWVYDILAGLGPNQAVDLLMACFEWENHHYKNQAQLYLLYMMQELVLRGVPLTMANVAKYVDPIVLGELIQPESSTNDVDLEPGSDLEGTDMGLDLEGPDDDVESEAPDAEEPSTESTPHETKSAQGSAEALKYLKGLSPKVVDEILGTLRRLQILVKTDVRPWIDPQTPDTEIFNIRKAVEKRDVVYFRLDADKRPETAEILVSTILQNLASTASEMQGGSLKLTVILDEFAAAPSANVVNLSARGRGAGVTLVLSSQSIADMDEQLRDQLFENAFYVIAHRQWVRTAATYLAEFGGDQWVRRESQDNHGRKTYTEDRELRVDPSDVQRLTTGQAVMFMVGEKPTVVDILPPESL